MQEIIKNIKWFFNSFLFRVIIFTDANKSRLKEIFFLIRIVDVMFERNEMKWGEGLIQNSNCRLHAYHFLE